MVKPVVTRRLLVMPALGEVAGARNLSLNNRTIAHYRADGSIAASCERSEQPIKTGAVHYQRSAEVHEIHNRQFGRPLVRAEGPVFIRIVVVAVALASAGRGTGPAGPPSRSTPQGTVRRLNSRVLRVVAGRWLSLLRYSSSLGVLHWLCLRLVGELIKTVPASRAGSQRLTTSSLSPRISKSGLRFVAVDPAGVVIHPNRQLLVGHRDLWCSLECTPACQAGGRGFKSRQVRSLVCERRVVRSGVLPASRCGTTVSLAAIWRQSWQQGERSGSSVGRARA